MVSVSELIPALVLVLISVLITEFISVLQRRNSPGSVVAMLPGKIPTKSFGKSVSFPDKFYQNSRNSINLPEIPVDFFRVS